MLCSTYRRRRSFWALIGLAVVPALVPNVLAYINGGDFHSTLKTFETKLKKNGWSVSFANPVPIAGDASQEVAKEVSVSPPDNPAYQRYVSQLVGRALKSLPEKEADSLSADAKREVVRLARGTIAKAVTSKKQVIQEGQTGALRYQAGTYACESYWETNYGGKREIHARRTGLVAFVALKSEPGDRDKSKP